MPEPDSPIIRRGVVALVSRGPRLLVIRRSRHVLAPGMICFPGGGIEAGETEPEALVREMREELNVACQPLRPVWRSVTSWRHELAWWEAALPDSTEPRANPEEVEDIAWLAPHEIRRLPDLLESTLDFLDAMRRGDVGLERAGGRE